MDIANIGDILASCRKGDNEAWNMLVQYYSRRVYNFCLNFIGDRDLAEDITQDVFIKIYDKLERFKDERNFSAWVYAVCKNYCIDYWRKNKKHLMTEESTETISSTSNSPEEEAIKASEKKHLRSLLKKLDPEIRTLLISRDILSLSYQQIADNLNIPEGTVKSRLNRARSKLSELYFTVLKT